MVSLAVGGGLGSLALVVVDSGDSMDRRSFISASGGAAAATLAMSSVAQAQSADPRQALAASSVIEDVKKRGQLRVGLSTFVPWVMRSKAGDLIGFEIDVTKQLCQDLGWQAEFVPTAWDGIIPALLSGKFDVIISSMAVTPQRLLSVNFTDPYSTSGLQIVAHRDKAKGFAKYEDFNRADVTLTARRGTPATVAAQQVMPKAAVRVFEDDALALQDVLNGNAHGMIASVPFPEHSATRNDKLLFVPVEGALLPWYSGFALRKGDPDALNLFNHWIRLKNTAGFIEKRHQYWFKTLEWEDQVARN